MACSDVHWCPTASAETGSSGFSADHTRASSAGSVAGTKSSSVAAGGTAARLADSDLLLRRPGTEPQRQVDAVVELPLLFGRPDRAQEVLELGLQVGIRLGFGGRAGERGDHRYSSSP